MDLIKLLSEARNKFDIFVSDESFHSSKLTQKLSQCLTDPIIVSAMSLPNWCNKLIFEYPCLFSREIRFGFFLAVYFILTHKYIFFV